VYPRERPRHAGQFAAAAAERWPRTGAVHAERRDNVSHNAWFNSGHAIGVPKCRQYDFLMQLDVRYSGITLETTGFADQHCGRWQHE